MKNLTKLLATLMACILMFSCVPALADEAEVLIDPATGAPYDLGGATILLYDWWSPADGSRVEATNAATQDRYDFQDWLMETYNFTMKEIYFGDYEQQSEDLLNYASAEAARDIAIITARPQTITAAMRSGLLQKLNFDFIDLDDPKWIDAITDFYTINGDVYALSTDKSLNHVLYFNKELVRDAGIDPQELYAMVENGDWTWEAFEDVMAKCTRDTDMDGVADVYGIVCGGMPEFSAAVYNNNGSFFYLNDEGKFEIGINDENTIFALNWIFNIFNTYRYKQPEGSNWNYYYESFLTGKAAFYYGKAWEIQDNGPLAALGDDFEFGAVPFPKGPAGDKYVSFVSPQLYIIPANVDTADAEKAMFALNLWTTTTPGYEDEEDAWKLPYYSLFQDDESVDLTLQILRDNTVLHAVDLLGTPNDLIGKNFIWNLGGNDAAQYTVAELIESKMPEWEAAVRRANGEEVVEVAE